MKWRVVQEEDQRNKDNKKGNKPNGVMGRVEKNVYSFLPYANIYIYISQITHSFNFKKENE